MINCQPLLIDFMSELISILISYFLWTSLFLYFSRHSRRDLSWLIFRITSYTAMSSYCTHVTGCNAFDSIWFHNWCRLALMHSVDSEPLWRSVCVHWCPHARQCEHSGALSLHAISSLLSCCGATEMWCSSFHWLLTRWGWMEVFFEFRQAGPVIHVTANRPTRSILCISCVN